MKNFNCLLSLILILFVANFCSAQEDDAKKSKKKADKMVNEKTENEKTDRNIYFGMNTTRFLKNIFSLNNTQVTATPFTFVYKNLNANNTNGLRVHLGFDFTNISENETGTLLKSNAYAGDLKIGYEWQKPATKNWRILYGVDAVSNYSFNSIVSVSGFDEVTISSELLRVGLSPFLGIAYNINSKLQFATEGQMNALYILGKRKDSFRNFPQSNVVRRNEGFDLVTNLPTNLFLIFKF